MTCPNQASLIMVDGGAGVASTFTAATYLKAGCKWNDLNKWYFDMTVFMTKL